MNRPVPPGMREGSHGTNALILGAFLIGQKCIPEGFDPSDAVFGPKMTEAVKMYQRKSSLEPDGDFASATRVYALEVDRFPFEEMVRKSISDEESTSFFVVKDGEGGYWI